MGVDVAVNQADLIAHVVAEEMSLGEMTTLLKLRRGQYALVEERVHPRTAAAGSAARGHPPAVRMRHRRRAPRGHPLLHDPDVVLAAEDEVLAVVHSAAAAELARLLGRATAEV
jgi:trk system potassium uptake protein